MVSRHDLIFKQWVASLAAKDKTKNAISGNFEELFSALRAEGLTLESAYDYLERAIKAHQPSASLIKVIYKRLKATGNPSTEKEFGEAWCKDIEDKGNAAFFEIFPVEIKVEEEEPVAYGTMTAKEYHLQREHADRYPRLDLDAIEKRISGQNYDPLSDISNLMGKNGNSN